MPSKHFNVCISNIYYICIYVYYYIGIYMKEKNTPSGWNILLGKILRIDKCKLF